MHGVARCWGKEETDSDCYSRVHLSVLQNLSVLSHGKPPDKLKSFKLNQFCIQNICASPRGGDKHAPGPAWGRNLKIHLCVCFQAATCCAFARRINFFSGYSFFKSENFSREFWKFKDARKSFLANNTLGTGRLSLNCFELSRNPGWRNRSSSGLFELSISLAEHQRKLFHPLSNECVPLQTSPSMPTCISRRALGRKLRAFGKKWKTIVAEVRQQQK